MTQLSRPPRQQPASTELAGALAACRRAFFAIALFSGMSNLLMLTGALFMLEIYDRVLPSRSVPTLVVLLILAGVLYAAQGLIDAIRSRILVRVGDGLDEAMSQRVYDVVVRLPLKIGSRGEGTQPIRDLDTVRGFLSGTGPVAFFDLPWMPIYLGICFLFHPYLGLTAVAGAVVLVALAILTEVQTRQPTRTATQFAAARNALMDASRRNAEAITAMGMVGRIARRWGDVNRNYVAASGRTGDVVGGLGAVSKVLRMFLQSAILAVGAWLVIHQEFNARHHHRRFDPRRPCACAGGPCHCQLARLRCGAAKLGASVAGARPHAGANRPDAAAGPVQDAGGAKRGGVSAR